MADGENIGGSEIAAQLIEIGERVERRAHRITRLLALATAAQVNQDEDLEEVRAILEGHFGVIMPRSGTPKPN